jgi:hypothetical protein
MPATRAAPAISAEDVPKAIHLAEQATRTRRALEFLASRRT